MTTLRICLHGPESTGKSTLGTRLAALHLLNTPYGIVCSNEVHGVLNGVRGIVFRPGIERPAGE